MEFFNPNANVNFMGIRRVTVAISILLIIGSIISLATRGLNFGLDFTGGSLVEVVYQEPIEQDALAHDLEAAKIEGAVIQRFSSTEFSIRLPPDVLNAADGTSAVDAANKAVTDKVKSAITAGGRSVEVKPSVFVGPQVGAELAYNGIVAVLVVLTGIMIYVAMRFEWRFAVATVAGELHDVIITLGFFSLTGMDFDLTVLAAILAVDGYSVNDKIVVFDRVRAIFRSSRKGDPAEILNRSVNSTLSRTIMTGVTTALAVGTLYFLGGPALDNFGLIMLIGIFIGIASSIFFANPVLLLLGVSKQDLMPVSKNDPELERRP